MGHAKLLAVEFPSVILRRYIRENNRNDELWLLYRPVSPWFSGRELVHVFTNTGTALQRKSSQIHMTLGRLECAQENKYLVNTKNTPDNANLVSSNSVDIEHALD